MNKIKVACEVTIYPKSESETTTYAKSGPYGSLATSSLIVKSATDYKECVILELDGKDYRVYASELKMAIDNALNAH